MLLLLQVRTFIKNEEQNFSLFNYVNEQTNEIEKLEEAIQQLREEEVSELHPPTPSITDAGRQAGRQAHGGMLRQTL